MCCKLHVNRQHVCFFRFVMWFQPTRKRKTISVQKKVMTPYEQHMKCHIKLKQLYAAMTRYKQRMCCAYVFIVPFYLFLFAICFYLGLCVFPFPRHTLRHHQRQSQFAEISETIPFSDVIAPWHFCKSLPSIVCKELRNATHVPPDAMANPMAKPKLAKPKLAKPEVGEA